MLGILFELYSRDTARRRKALGVRDRHLYRDIVEEGLRFKKYSPPRWERIRELKWTASVSAVFCNLCSTDVIAPLFFLCWGCVMMRQLILLSQRGDRLANNSSCSPKASVESWGNKQECMHGILDVQFYTYLLGILFRTPRPWVKQDRRSHVHRYQDILQTSAMRNGM